VLEYPSVKCGSNEVGTICGLRTTAQLGQGVSGLEDGHETPRLWVTYSYCLVDKMNSQNIS